MTVANIWAIFFHRLPRATYTDSS